MSELNSFSDYSEQSLEILIADIDEVTQKLPDKHFDYVQSLDPQNEAIYKLARYAGKNTIKNEYLEFENRHDYLTGILNRRGMDIAIDEAINNAKPFGLLRFDLDKFKNVNDTFGHDEGDKALREFATLLAKTIRTSDILGFAAREGGDEFMGLIPLDAPRRGKGKKMLPHQRFSAFTSRLRKVCDEMVEAHPEWAEQGFNVSIGGALWTQNADISRQQLVSAADYSLYKNKAAIKGTVV